MLFLIISTLLLRLFLTCYSRKVLWDYDSKGVASWLRQLVIVEGRVGVYVKLVEKVLVVCN
jgi:hypothetical protein